MGTNVKTPKCPVHKDIDECLQAMSDIKRGMQWNPDRDKCPLTRWKSGMITCRRNKETTVGRDMFKRWKENFEEYIDWYVQHLGARWIVSAADTYMDYGTPLEKANAAIISAMVNCERFAMTERAWHPKREKLDDPPPRQLGVQGLATLSPGKSADCHRNLIRRIRKIMEPTPVLWKMFRQTQWALSDSSLSTLSILNGFFLRDLCDDVRKLLKGEEVLGGWMSDV